MGQYIDRCIIATRLIESWWTHRSLIKGLACPHISKIAEHMNSTHNNYYSNVGRAYDLSVPFIKYSLLV